MISRALMRAEQPDAGGVDENNIIVDLDEQSVRRKFDQAAIPFLADEQGFLGAFALQLEFRLVQCAMQCRGQRAEMMLQHEIRRAALQGFDRHFLTQRAGDENERDIRAFLLRQVERGKSVERRQAMIGQNDVRFEFLDFAQKTILGIDAFKREVEAALPQSMLRKLGITRLVLYH